MISIAVLGTLLGAVGCSAPPAPERLAEVRGAEAAALGAEAEAYAPDAWAEADDLNDRLDAELKVQEQRMAWFRDYGESEWLADQTLDAMKAATEAATTGKERARLEVAELIAEARTKLDELRGRLESAAQGKSTQADLAVFKSDADGARATLADVEADAAAGDYALAQLEVRTLVRGIERLTGEIESARERQRRRIEG